MATATQSICKSFAFDEPDTAFRFFIPGNDGDLRQELVELGTANVRC